MAKQTEAHRNLWPIVVGVLGSVVVLGWMGAMTMVLLKPNEQSAVLVEMLQQERAINERLVLAATERAVEAEQMALSRAQSVEEIATRAANAGLSAIAPVNNEDPGRQTVDILAQTLAQSRGDAARVIPLVRQEDCANEIYAAAQNVVIPFGINSVAPEAETLRPALALIEQLAGCDSVKVAVEGHSDSTGDNVQNLLLSWQRADNTIIALADLGAATDRLEARGFGSRHLIAGGGSAEAAARNRRVQFTVIPVN